MENSGYLAFLKNKTQRLSHALTSRASIKAVDILMARFPDNFIDNFIMSRRRPRHWDEKVYENIQDFILQKCCQYMYNGNNSKSFQFQPVWPRHS